MNVTKSIHSSACIVFCRGDKQLVGVVHPSTQVRSFLGPFFMSTVLLNRNLLTKLRDRVQHISGKKFTYMSIPHLHDSLTQGK